MPWRNRWMILNITTVESGRAFSSGSNQSAPGQRVKILYQDVNKAIDHGNRGRSGLALAPPLLAALLLLATLMPSQLPAQTNTAKAPPSSHRWLLIVETSRSMQRRSDAVLTAVQDLLTSGMVGQLRPGDTLGVWTLTATSTPAASRSRHGRPRPSRTSSRAPSLSSRARSTKRRQTSTRSFLS